MREVCLDVSAHRTPGETCHVKRIHCVGPTYSKKLFALTGPRARACKWEQGHLGVLVVTAGVCLRLGGPDALERQSLRAKLQPTRPPPSRSCWTFGFDLSRLRSVPTSGPRWPCVLPAALACNTLPLCPGLLPAFP